MTKELPTKVMGKTSTTYNPYRTGDPTRWPMLALSQNLITAVSPETQTEVLKAKPQNESDKLILWDGEFR
jgi:hypothetical protein